MTRIICPVANPTSQSKRTTNRHRTYAYSKLWSFDYPKRIHPEYSHVLLTHYTDCRVLREYAENSKTLLTLPSFYHMCRTSCINNLMLRQAVIATTHMKQKSYLKRSIRVSPNCWIIVIVDVH